MNNRVRQATALVVVWTLLTTPVLAWDGKGHRTVAAIAFKAMRPATRDQVASLLAKHRGIRGENIPADSDDEKLAVFLHAAVFPDEIRDLSNDYHYLHRSSHHYVNFPVYGSPRDRWNPRIDARNPYQNSNILKAYADNVRRATSTQPSDEERAVAVSWLIHLIGDIHQPLHAVGRFSTAFPQGDLGGNAVMFPNARGDEKGQNLHAYWDDLLDNSLADEGDPIKLADDLRAAYPRDKLDELARLSRIEGWAQESFELARKVVYRNLDPNQKRFDALPAGYEADAMRAAKRRVALAGYRLADELETLFGEAAE
jgi:hypothetical protein